MKEIILIFNAAIGEVSNDKLKIFSDKFSEEVEKIEHSEIIKRNKIDVDLSNNQLFIRVTKENDDTIPLGDLARTSMNALKTIFVNNISNITFVHNEDIHVGFNVFEDEEHVKSRGIIPEIIGVGRKFTAIIDDKTVEATIEPNYNRRRTGNDEYLYYHCLIPVAQPGYENIPTIVEDLNEFTSDFKDKSVNLYRGVDADGNQF